jgi:putative phage-type endonuclease
MIILDVPQLSPEWLAAKLGVPSASNFDKIVTIEGKPSKSRQNYMYQLAGEKVSGAHVETYQNAAMLRGIELEAEARQTFEFIKNVEVKQVGLCFPDESRLCSCSPDGLLSAKDEGLEIKCPLIHTHVSYLLEDKLPVEYFQQVHGSMLVTGFKYWYFMSYFPGLPIFIKKIERDEIFIKKLADELQKFCLELAGLINKLRNL